MARIADWHAKKMADDPEYAAVVSALESAGVNADPIQSDGGGLLILDADIADALEPLLASGAEGQAFRRVDAFNFVLVDPTPTA